MYKCPECWYDFSRYAVILPLMNFNSPRGALFKIQSCALESKNPTPPNVIPQKIPSIDPINNDDKIGRNNASLTNEPKGPNFNRTADTVDRNIPYVNLERFCSFLQKSFNDVTTITPEFIPNVLRIPRNNIFSGPARATLVDPAPAPIENNLSAL